MQTQEDLFVIRTLIAGELDRARAENALHAARGPGRAGLARAVPGRGWLGRRLIAMGTFLATEPGATPRSSPERPC
jgi:hypothetical protein